MEENGALTEASRGPSEDRARGRDPTLHERDGEAYILIGSGMAMRHERGKTGRRRREMGKRTPIRAKETSIEES